MTEKYTEDKRLLGALDYIDDKFIAEVTDDYEIFDYVGKPTRKMRLRIARQYLVYAACLVLLACAMPIVSYIVPQIGELFGGNAGNVGDTETRDLDGFADMSERDLIEHIGKVPKEFKDIVQNNAFKRCFYSGDYIFSFPADSKDSEIIVFDKQCEVVDIINSENGVGVFGSYRIYRLSDGNYVKLGSYSSYYRYMADSNTSERKETKASVEKITSDGKTVFKTEFDIRNDLDFFCELDDGYVIAGWEQRWSDTENQKFYIYKLDKSGNIVHQKAMSEGICKMECIDGELVIYTRHRQFVEKKFKDVYRKQYLDDSLLMRSTIDTLEPPAEYLIIEDFIPNFDAGYVSSVIYYDDFVLIISEHNTKWFEYVPMVYSSIPSYTETVYTAYTYGAEIIWRSAVDSTDYERLAKVKKEYEEEQERFKKWKSENE